MPTTTTISQRPCLDALKRHPDLAGRYGRSKERLAKVRGAFENCNIIREDVKEHPLAIFCAGSLARMEVGDKSDLDLFVTAGEDNYLRGRLFSITLFSELMSINKQLSFPPFSNDGEYLKVYFMKDLKSSTGSRLDDSENLFTARMLLLLESQFVVNEPIYRKHVREILDLYYRDESDDSLFRPIFLLNDLLRYWRTICLNYEERRRDSNWPFRKKNVNLKFSRMLTVFSTVLPLIVDSSGSVDNIDNLCRKTPLERLATGLDLLNDSDLTNRWRGILDVYEEFLSWKEADDVEDFLAEHKNLVHRHAGTLSIFLYDALTHKGVPDEFRRYLIL